jgi:hypothetical protein
MNQNSLTAGNRHQQFYFTANAFVGNEACKIKDFEK